jgi:hypothetical protein
MSNQYQNNNYKSTKKKPKEDCGCNHKEPKKMNNLVDLQWFKILGSNKKGSK